MKLHLVQQKNHLALQGHLLLVLDLRRVQKMVLPEHDFHQEFQHLPKIYQHINQIRLWSIFAIKIGWLIVYFALHINHLPGGVYALIECPTLR